MHGRSRRSVIVDLGTREGADVVLRLAGKADGLMEPFRPGVAERLGIGPEPCLRANPRLVYGRMTGWGQEGGGMLLAFGMVCGLLDAQRSGRGQVVDAAMVDGSALLVGAMFGLHAAGLWKDERGRNLLDSGAPFYEVYEVYETRDGTYVCVGSLEPQFFALLVEKTGCRPTSSPRRWTVRAGRR